MFPRGAHKAGTKREGRGSPTVQSTPAIKSLPASQSLAMKLRLCSPPLTEARRRLWTHPRVTELFPTFLFRMYCEARATVRLLTAARARLLRTPGDPLAPGLIAYLTEHIPEETGHDVWLLESLEVLGFPRDLVMAKLPPPAVAQMVGAQDYWILHHHPVALLGYIKVVEHDSASAAVLEDVIARTGLPRGAFRFHFGHADIEPHHNEDLDLLLDTLPLEPQHEALVGVSTIHTMRQATAVLSEIVTLFEARSPAADPAAALF